MPPWPKGRARSLQTKQKISQAKKQHYQQHPKPPLTTETKQKISAGRRRYFAMLRHGLALTFRERGIFIALQPVRNEQRFEKIAAIKPTEKIPEKKLYKAIKKLTPLERRIIEQKFGLRGEEKNFKQIAQTTRTNTAHVIKIYNNALQKLRREIQKI